MWLLRFAICALVLTGCDLFSQLGKLNNPTVMVGTLISTPAFTVDSKALGLSGMNCAPCEFPARTTAYTYFGTRPSGEALAAAPTGLSGASVTLNMNGGGSWPLNDNDQGNYLLSPIPSFTYQPHVRYWLTTAYQGYSFEVQVTDPPYPEKIEDFKRVIFQGANSPFTLTRPQSSSRPIGFVAVFRLTQNGLSDAPTYTNVPTSAQGLISLVTAPDIWKTPSVIIPSTAFPDSDSAYAIVFTTVVLDTQTSSTLSLGSSMMAGSSDIGIVSTHKP